MYFRFLAICIDVNMNWFVFIKIEIESHTEYGQQCWHRLKF